MPETISNNKRVNDLKNLAEDIIASYGARKKIVNEIVEDTHKMLDSFKSKREEMSGNLREILAKFESLRKKDFNAMMQDILITQQKREDSVKKMLADFREEETRVAERLKELLKKGEEIRIIDFKRTLSRIRREQTAKESIAGEQIRIELANMQSEVSNMLAAFKKERGTAKEEWQKVIDLLAKK